MSGQLAGYLDFLEGKTFIHMRMTGIDPEMLCIRGCREITGHEDRLVTEFHIDVHVTSGHVQSEEQFVEFGRFDELEYVRSSVPSGTVLGILETCGWFPALWERLEVLGKAYTLVGECGLHFDDDVLFDAFEYRV